MKVDADGSLDVVGTNDEIDWRWLLVPSVLGLGLIELAVVADVRWNWQDIWPAVFLEVGATLGLAAILFGFERRFVRRVGRSTLPCTLADPSAAVQQVTTFDGQIKYQCGHDPRHIWDAFGAREQ